MVGNCNITIAIDRSGNLKPHMAAHCLLKT